MKTGETDDGFFFRRPTLLVSTEVATGKGVFCQRVENGD